MLEKQHRVRRRLEMSRLLPLQDWQRRRLRKWIRARTHLRHSWLITGKHSNWKQRGPRNLLTKWITILIVMMEILSSYNTPNLNLQSKEQQIWHKFQKYKSSTALHSSQTKTKVKIQIQRKNEFIIRTPLCIIILKLEKMKKLGKKGEKAVLTLSDWLVLCIKFLEDWAAFLKRLPHQRRHKKAQTRCLNRKSRRTLHKNRWERQKDLNNKLRLMIKW